MDDFTNGPRPLNVAKARAKFFVLYKEAGLDGDREARIALARFVLGRPVRSFTELDADDWYRMLDSIVGWFSVRELRRQNGLIDD